jgi:Membrane bound O-acyl transferase family
MDIVLIGLLAWCILLFLVGYSLPALRRQGWGRAIAWSLIVGTTVFVHYLTYLKPPLYRMIALVSLQLLSIKAIVMVEVYANKKSLSFWSWCAFVSWFGMRPRLFERLFTKPLHGAGKLLGKGVSRILVGLFLLYLSKQTSQSLGNMYFLTALLALVGLSFVLHFGILNISTAFWRLGGIDVRELFRAPYQARSLQEFWGKRWNMAFSEMTAIIVYKPLKTKLGNQIALIASFLLSGILHEIAISLPVGAGFGLPLLYFVLQSFAMQIENKIAWIKQLTSHHILSHVWVFCWLVLPMPFLFHEKFIQEVVFPLRDLIF